MRHLKQWGLKRTGTNYLRWLIEANFQDVRVLADVLGWKHGLPTLYPTMNPREWYPEWKPDFIPVTEKELQAIQMALAADRVGHVMLVKDPVGWIDSMARYHKLEVRQLSAANLNQLVNQWNTTTYAYTLFPGAILRYEDILTLPTNTLGYLKEHFSLPCQDREWQLDDHRFERGNDGQSPDTCRTDAIHDKAYWTERKYLRKFQDGQLKVLRELLDPALLERFSYEI